MTPFSNPVLAAATAYIDAGISVVPTSQDKIATIQWKPRTVDIPTYEDVKKDFAGNAKCVALVAGTVSGNLECIDFDFKAKYLDEWLNLVDEVMPELVDKLVMQKTQSGGCHAIYRCAEPIPGNQKLATEGIEVSGPGEHEYQGKKFKAVERNGKYFITPCFIETRGQNGYFLCYPSKGYTISQGKISQVPTISAKDRNALIQAAKALNKWMPDARPDPQTRQRGPGLSPGDDYGHRGDVAALLLNHGWTPTGRAAQDGELWRRPGKDKGWSATLFTSNSLYVFSSNAPPFDPDTSYSPLAVYTLLNHGGDYKAAVKDLASQGYGEDRPAPPHTEQPTDPREEPAGSEKPTVAPKFEFIHNAQILESLQPIEWQIEDVLVKNALYYDFGDPGSYKTFGALDRLLCIASGIDYHGHRVGQGTVFYIAGEGQQGIGRRIAAWHIAHKTKAADIPFFMAKNPTQLMDAPSLEGVRFAVDTMAKEYGPPAVLHIDTLARNFGEGDENATRDMNKVIQNMDAAFGNDFCRGVTHHTGHMNKGRARGSIALHGAADEAFRFSSTPSGQILVECKKMKDAPYSLPMLFDLETILLLIGDHEDKSFALSLAAEGDEAAAASSNTEKASGNMGKAIDLLAEMYSKYEKNLADNGRHDDMARVEIKDWREACLDKKLYARRSTFAKSVERMVNRGLAFLDETGAHICTSSIYLKYKEKGLVF